MNNELLSESSCQAASSESRKTWCSPTIEDADIGEITSGSGTSGVEGTSFLKPGS